MIRFLYRVSWCDDFNEKILYAEGYIMAESNVKATEALVRHYGDKEIDEFQLKTDCGDSVIEMKRSETSLFGPELKGVALNEGF